METDVKKRPMATLHQRREFMRRIAGMQISDSTVSKMLKRMGSSRKSDGCGRTPPVPEGNLESDSRRRDGAVSLRLRGQVYA